MNTDEISDEILQDVINLETKEGACPESFSTPGDSEDWTKMSEAHKLEEMRLYCAKLTKLNQKLIEENNKFKVGCWNPVGYTVIYDDFGLVYTRIKARKEAKDCCICLEDTSNARKLALLVPCGHTVCEECSPKILGAPCPTCRRICTQSIVGQGIYG